MAPLELALERNVSTDDMTTSSAASTPVIKAKTKVTTDLEEARLLSPVLVSSTSATRSLKENNQDNGLSPSIVDLWKQVDRLLIEAKTKEEEGEEDDVSLVLQACQVSLRDEIKALVHQVETLATTGLRDENNDVPLMLAQDRVKTYLETLRLAITSYATSHSANCYLRKVFAGNDQPLLYSVSAWRTPSLAFDLRLDSANFQDSNIDLNVRVLAELLAKDFENTASTTPSFSPCLATVEKCRHDTRYTNANGVTTGVASVHIRLLAQEQKQVLKVKEARVLQVNSVPPRPRANVDFYTSVLHGSNDVVVSLHVKTLTTSLSGNHLNLGIDLIMASC